jgi:hypothetical protein
MVPVDPLASFDVSGQQRISNTGASPNDPLFCSVSIVKRMTSFVNADFLF